MFEKRLAAVSPQSFTSDGTSRGIVNVADAGLFKVKQQVIIKANTLPNLELEVKQVTSPTQLMVGPPSGDIQAFQDISAYTVALAAAIFANEQLRPKIGVV